MPRSSSISRTCSGGCEVVTRCAFMVNVCNKRLIRIVVSVALLCTIFIGVLAATLAGKNSINAPPSSPSSTSESLMAACNTTVYPDSCYSTMSKSTAKDPGSILKLFITAAMESLQNVSSIPDTLAERTDKYNPTLAASFRDCGDLLVDALDRLNETLEMDINHGDIRSFLSASITDQETCLDGLDAKSRAEMAAVIVNATRLTSNTLALVTSFQNSIDQIDHLLHGRKLLTWESAAQRKLLQTAAKTVPNVTVAKDGTGDFTTIKEALERVPEENGVPFVIYIKAGVYEEYVTVNKSMWNVTLVGDGMYDTVVSGSLNKVDGVSTFRSATVAVVGRGFMAIDIGFRNTAGPEKHQAVALRCSADHAVFFRCSFVAYQDTLYVHALRQFYRECHIVGTVDFIFGDASAVLQNCLIRPREPMPGQKNTVTAQGRTDPNENTGISIQGCTISPFGNLTALTYLGRPWKEYSTTIVMDTEIGGMVAAEGWLEWEAGKVPAATVYYAEYRNSGEGAALGGRVTWPGYRGLVSIGEAAKFTVDAFIRGGEWIPLRGVAFSSNLG